MEKASKRERARWAMLVGLCLLAGPGRAALLASGTYVLRPPQPSLVDTERYEAGKAVFLGKLQASAGAAESSAAQAPRLQALQERLPAKVRRTTNLTTLAGTLSGPQVAALEYYLKVRFKVQ